MKLAGFALILALAVPHLRAQTTPCSVPTATTFDVASVKPSQIGADSSRNGGSADSITASSTAFRMIEYDRVRLRAA